jgi:hypothetical protein
MLRSGKKFVGGNINVQAAKRAKDLRTFQSMQMDFLRIHSG